MRQRIECPLSWVTPPPPLENGILVGIAVPDVGDPLPQPPAPPLTNGLVFGWEVPE